MENKTGLEKLLASLVFQSIDCTKGVERYILSGIIDYTKKLIEEEKDEGKKYSGSEVSDMMKASYRAAKSDPFTEVLQDSLDNQIREKAIAFCVWYSKLRIVDKVTLHNPYGQCEVSGGIYTKPIEQLYKDFLNEDAKKAKLSEPNVEK